MTHEDLKKILEVNKSDVVLTETHQYFLDGTELFGITEMIKSFISPNKYAFVDEDVLENARKRGDRLHNELETYVNSGIAPVEQTEDYCAMIDALKEHDLVAGEYIVTDKVRTASPIDLITLHNGEVCIVDLKNTAVIDQDAVMWQTNIYRVFLERQTMLKANKLFCLHVYKGEAKLIELPIIEDKHVDYIFECWFDFGEFVNPLMQAVYNHEELLYKTYNVCLEIARIEEQRKMFEEEHKKLTAGLLQIMQENAVKTFENELIKITIKKASTRESLDTKAIKETYPEIYAQHKKITEVKESLIIKIK